MRCPFCSNEETQVKDSRPTEDGTAIRRRRYCPDCSGRFTTFERVQLRELTVVKKNGQRVQFDRDKLARSIQVACRKRPVDPERMERVELITMSYGGYEARVGTPKLLELLDQLDLKATFFVTGWSVDAHPAMAEAILKAGHEIGHHGYHHLLPDQGQVLDHAPIGKPVVRRRDCLVRSDP